MSHKYVFKKPNFISESCTITFPMNNNVGRCTSWYKMTSEDQSSYSLRWMQYQHKDKPTYLDKAFIYQSEKQLKALPYWGQLEMYSGGGYVSNLGKTKPESWQIFDDLERNRWIDYLTRVVFVEFNILNMNSNLFSLVVVAYEFPPVGGVYTWTTIDTVQLYRYTGSVGLLSLLVELLTLVWFTVITVLTIRQAVKMKLKFFTQFWNVMKMFALLFFIIAFSLYVYRSVWTQRIITEMLNNKGDIQLTIC